jgi:hypothetical protein
VRSRALTQIINTEVFLLDKGDRKAYLKISIQRDEN